MWFGGAVLGKNETDESTAGSRASAVQGDQAALITSTELSSPLCTSTRIVEKLTVPFNSLEPK